MLLEMGHHFCEAIIEYTQLLDDEEHMKEIIGEIENLIQN